MSLLEYYATCAVADNLNNLNTQCTNCVPLCQHLMWRHALINIVVLKLWQMMKLKATELCEWWTSVKTLPMPVVPLWQHMSTSKTSRINSWFCLDWENTQEPTQHQRGVAGWCHYKGTDVCVSPWIMYFQRRNLSQRLVAPLCSPLALSSSADPLLIEPQLWLGDTAPLPGERAHEPTLSELSSASVGVCFRGVPARMYGFSMYWPPI